MQVPQVAGGAGSGKGPLRWGWALALLAVPASAIVAAVVWSALPSKPTTAAAVAQQDVIGLRGAPPPPGYEKVVETRTETVRPAGQRATAKADPPARPPVFGRGDRFDNPNDQLAKAEAESWVEAGVGAGGGATPGAGTASPPWPCEPPEGAELRAQQVAGVLRVVGRPVYGRDGRGRACRAVNPGDELELEEVAGGDGQAPSVCAVRHTDAEGVTRELGCWLVYRQSKPGSRSGNVFSIRTASAIGEG